MFYFCCCSLTGMVTSEALHNIRGRPCIWHHQTCVAALMTWEEDPWWENLEVLWWSSVVHLWRQEVLKDVVSLYLLTWLGYLYGPFHRLIRFSVNWIINPARFFFFFHFSKSSFPFTAIEVYATTMTSEKPGNVKMVQYWFHSFLKLHSVWRILLQIRFKTFFFLKVVIQELLMLGVRYLARGFLWLVECRVLPPMAWDKVHHQQRDQ